MENSVASRTGASPPHSVWCPRCEKGADSEKNPQEHVENLQGGCSQKGRGVQKRPNQTTELHEHQKINLRLMIAGLHTKLMEAQLERDALEDARRKEAQSQEKVKTQLKNTIQELEAANRVQEELLREADSQTEQLRRMVQSHEEVLLDLHGILVDYEDSTGKKLCEHENIPSLHIHSLSTVFADILQDLASEVSDLKEKVVLVEGELETLKKDSQTPSQLLLQQHQNREQRRTQNSVHAHQVGRLEPAGSQLPEARRMYEDKVEGLEKQLHLAHSEVAEAQTDQDQHSQEPGHLDDQIHQLVVAARKERNESSGRISSLSAQLESTKETLCQVEEDLGAKQLDLETAEKAVPDLTACLREKERALEVARKEMQRLHSQLGSGMQELQHLRKEENHLQSVQAECEALRGQVLEKERLVEIFQKQVESMTQLVGQHGRAAGAMEAEKSQLVKERNEWKHKVEELKIAKDEEGARAQEMEKRLGELEMEKVQLVNTCAERLLALQDMKLEKEQLRKELQASQSKLAGLAEVFEDLKRDYQDKIKEMGNTASRLTVQLKSAQAELTQTRTALKTLEGSDGNAMKVAVGMQKKITAKRGQIDALQSKVKLLEEAMTNAAKEKHYLREEKTKLSQEVSYITAENTKLAGELEILRSQDKRLKEKISKMETALDKASLQFAECQCRMQCQQQEVMRCRLQHTLDLKELQGPGYSSVSAPAKLWHMVPLPHLPSAVVPPSLAPASSAPGLPSKPGILKEEPLQDLKRILQELRSPGSDIPCVDLGEDVTGGGKKSPLAAMRSRVEAAARDSPTESILEKAALGWDPSSLHTADLEAQGVTQPFTSLGGVSISAAPCYTSSHKKVPREERYRERSPVHMLLTSSPDDLAAGPSTSAEHRAAPGKVVSPEAAATGPQIKNTPRRLPPNKMESLQNLVESLERKSQALSSMIRTQGLKMERAKGKEKKMERARRKEKQVSQ